MIKLLLLLFSFTFAYTANIVYLFPDEQTKFVHDLSRKLSAASSQILILSPSLSHSEIKKSILTAAKKGIPVKLIVNNPKGDPLYMLQYSNIDLSLYDKRVMEGTIVIVDNTFICTSPGAINQEKFASNRLLIRCSNDTDEINLIQNLLSDTLKHSSPYLK